MLFSCSVKKVREKVLYYFNYPVGMAADVTGVYVTEQFRRVITKIEIFAFQVSFTDEEPNQSIGDADNEEGTL